MGKADTALLAAVLAYSTVVSVWYAVSGPLDHDENLFTASAFMVARYGLHPYQDFAYHHMPNLVYVYSAFFLLPYPFLLARLFVGICAVGICLAIFLTARSLFASHGRLTSLIIPVSSAALLLHSPLFQYGSSHVWNHTPSTLCAVLAFLLHCQAIRGIRPLLYFFLSGVSLGMAIGVRLTFAPLAAPFLFAAVVFRPGTVREKRLNVLAFTLGGLLANLPAVYFAATSYQDFLWGNVIYPLLTAVYVAGSSFPMPMTLAEKVKAVRDAVFGRAGDLLILLVALYGVALSVIDSVRRRVRFGFEIVFLLLLLPFLYFGSMAPTPTWYQYHFATVPFLILLSLYTLSSLRWRRLSEPAGVLLAVAALISFVYGSPFASGSIAGLVKPEAWTPVRLRKEALSIRRYVEARGGEGPVLTLSPLYAIEAGLPIYKEFAMGPFAWRVSHLVFDEEAADRGLPSRLGIERFISDKRPRAILTGKEGELEVPIIRAAQRLGYEPVETSAGVVVWLRPE